MLNLKITTVIVEKNSEDLKEINSVLKKIDTLKILGTATTGNKGISLITNYAPNLIFVNVDLKDVDGIEFIRVLQSRNIYPEVVFLANNNKHAYESLEVEPFDYLTKPIEREKVEQMLERLKVKLKRKELIRKMNIFSDSNQIPEKRVFTQKGGITIVPLEEIVFCKAELTRTSLQLRCGEKIQLKTGITETLETINSDDFIRIGRSHCINRKYLRKIDKRQSKCHLLYEEQSWEVPTSKNTIVQLEKLNVSPMY